MQIDESEFNRKIFRALHFSFIAKFQNIATLFALIYSAINIKEKTKNQKSQWNHYTHYFEEVLAFLLILFVLDIAVELKSVVRLGRRILILCIIFLNIQRYA